MDFSSHTPNTSDFVRIPLTQNQYAIIDKKNEERVNAYLWFACFNRNNNKFYAYTKINKKLVHLSNFIMNHDKTENKYFQIDHINRNTYDYREINLRKVTVCQNMLNRANRKGGIYHNKTAYCYHASWTENKKNKIKCFIYGIKNKNNREEQKKQKELARKFRLDKIKTITDYIIALRLDNNNDENLIEDINEIEISNSLLVMTKRVKRNIKNSQIVKPNISYCKPTKGKPFLTYRSSCLGINADGTYKTKKMTIGTKKNPTYEIALDKLEQFKKEQENKSNKS